MLFFNALIFFFPEQTTVKIEGKVPKYAKKIAFTEADKTAFTYIKTDTTGKL